VIDLSKLQYYSGANSFKNDGTLYSGTMTFPTSIPSHSFVVTTHTETLAETPQFSMMYAYFQEYLDHAQQDIGSSEFNAAQWYQTSVNTKIGLTVTAPSGSAGPLDALIYPVINGTTLTVTGLVNNPYGDAITITALDVPWRFISYTMTS
jgi:hypothetical protein